MLGFAAVGLRERKIPWATPQAVNCIEFMMYILPPLILLVALAIYFKKFKLKPALVKQISHEIQQRRGTEYRLILVNPSRRLVRLEEQGKSAVKWHGGFSNNDFPKD